MNWTPSSMTTCVPGIDTVMNSRCLMAENDHKLDYDDAEDFLSVLDGESSRVLHAGGSVSLIFIKIAQFEEMARNLGEQYALRLVKELDLLIRINIRAKDREFIYGKNEFMLILPDTTKEGAKQLLFKLKRIIENFPARDRDGSQVKLVPRFGISSYPL